MYCITTYPESHLIVTRTVTMSCFPSGQLRGVRVAWILFFWGGRGGRRTRICMCQLKENWPARICFWQLDQQKNWFICWVLTQITLLTSCWFCHVWKCLLWLHMLSLSKSKHWQTLHASAYDMPVGGSKKKKNSSNGIVCVWPFFASEGGIQVKEPRAMKSQGEQKKKQLSKRKKKKSKNWNNWHNSRWLGTVRGSVSVGRIFSPSSKRDGLHN